MSKNEFENIRQAQDYCSAIVCPDGTVYDENWNKARYLKNLPEPVVLIKDQPYTIASLLALLFLEYKEGCNFVGYKDGNSQNYQLDNLFLTDQPHGNQNNLTPNQRKHCVKLIEDYIDKGLEDTVEVKNMQMFLNGANVQGKRAPIQYDPIDMQTKKSGQFAPVVQVFDKNGCHLMYGSSKDIQTKLGVPLFYTFKGYTQGRITKEGYEMVPVALVPKQHINAMVQITNEETGVVYSPIPYVRTCLMFNLHFESLSDILNYTDDEQVTFENYSFRIVAKGSLEK